MVTGWLLFLNWLSTPLARLIFRKYQVKLANHRNRPKLIEQILPVDPLSIRTILPFAPVAPIGVSRWGKDVHNAWSALPDAWDCQQEKSSHTDLKNHLKDNNNFIQQKNINKETKCITMIMQKHIFGWLLYLLGNLF